MECFWELRRNRPDTTKSTFSSVDVLFRVDKQGINGGELDGGFRGEHTTFARPKLNYPGDPSITAINFFMRCAQIAGGKPFHDDFTAAKFILPASAGYIARSDFLSQRLTDCEVFENFETFYGPRQFVRGWSDQECQSGGLFQIISNAMGGFLLKTSSSAQVLTDLMSLEAELINRLSFPFLSEAPVAKRTIALVDGRTRADTEPIIMAANALGIDLVILDSVGHWISTEKYQNPAVRFVALDMTVNDGLPLRIVRALSDSGIKIDGLTSNYDWLTLPVSTAASFLGLPCESLEALNICRDKYRQRLASGDPAVQVKKGENTTARIDGTFDYPMIVKPSGGLNSEGVSKVSNPGELEAAVDRLFSIQYDHISNVEAANIEEYCDGPEIDVNMVLLEGELLFAEIADDFPKAGDEEGGTSQVFKESAMLYPSEIPPAEQERVLASLHKTLLNIGLKSGVYHVEARVANSRTQYIEQDGFLDLRDITNETSQEEVSVVLIEVNARLPGLMVKSAVNSTYGIDYGALLLLMSVGDSERIKSFCQPFLNGPQYWSEACFITTDRGGVFRSGDLGETLQQERPDLACNVSCSLTYFRKGEVVPPLETDSQPWIAWFLIFSRVSRRDLLEKVRYIREAVHLEFE